MSPNKTIDELTSSLSVQRRKLESVETLLKDRESALSNLNERLEAVALEKNVSKVVIDELQDMRFKNIALERILLNKTESEVTLQLKANQLSERVKDLQLERANHLELIKQEQNQRLEAESKIKKLDERLSSTFKAEDLSHYLTQTIEHFNSSINQNVDSQVNYIINHLDIEMKAFVAQGKDKEVLMSAPNLATSSEQALSTVRFSISAVPRDMASRD